MSGACRFLRFLLVWPDLRGLRAFAVRFGPILAVSAPSAVTSGFLLCAPVGAHGARYTPSRKAVTLEIELAHHLYSSSGGYRTLFSSPELPPEVAAKAEDVAKKLYRIVGAQPQRGFYHAAPGLAAAVRGFQFGTDHAGRARTCIHTVFLPEEQLAAVPGFSPFLVPDDLFIPEDTDVQYLSSELRQTWSAPPSFPRPSVAGIHPDWIRLLFPSLLDAVSATIVVDTKLEAGGMIAALSHALPPANRRSLSYIEAAHLTPSSPPVFQITICEKLPDDTTASDVAVIDLSGGHSRNLPPSNAYSDFVAASMAANAEDLGRFIAVFEKHEPDRRFSLPELAALAKQYPETRHLFRRDGGVATHAPADGCNAVVPYFRAGAMRLAYTILDELLVAHAQQAAGLLRQKMRDWARQPNEAGLAALVKEARKLLGVAATRDDDTNFDIPESNTIADHMMEDSDDDLHLDAGKIG